MTLKRFLLQNFNTSPSIFHQTKSFCIHVQKRSIDSAPIPSLLQQLQPETSKQKQHDNTQHTPSFTSDQDTQLFTRTIITPKPFNRYHHLWLHKTLTNEKRIKSLPIPTPNHKTIPIVTCIMHHIIINGPSTLESLWRGIRPLGVIKSKRRLKKTIKRYSEKYPETLPFVNINKPIEEQINTNNSDEIKSDDSDSDTDSESESESDIESGSETEFKIDSDFSDSDSSITTDSDGLQPAVYGIRPEKKEKLIRKYDEKWKEIEQEIETGKIEIYGNNVNLWWYSISEHKKPIAKGPILWNELMERSKTDKGTKGKLNKNKITNQTPVFNFAMMDEWRLLGDVIKQM